VSIGSLAILKRAVGSDTEAEHEKKLEAEAHIQAEEQARNEAKK